MAIKPFQYADSNANNKSTNTPTPTNNSRIKPFEYAETPKEPTIPPIETPIISQKPVEPVAVPAWQPEEKKSLFGKVKDTYKAVSPFMSFLGIGFNPIENAKKQAELVEKGSQWVFDKTLNTEKGKEIGAIVEKGTRGSSAFVATPKAFYQATKDIITGGGNGKDIVDYYDEAVKKWETGSADETNTMAENVARGVLDSGVQSAVGVLLNLVPFVGRGLSAGYFTTISAQEQIQERGKVDSPLNVGIDVAGDMLLGNLVEGILKAPAKALTKAGFKTATNIGKGFLVEGTTEPAQTLLKYANDYRNAGNPEDKKAIIEKTKDYVKNGGMALEFLVGGFSGGIIAGGASAVSLNNVKEYYKTDIENSKAFDIQKTIAEDPAMAKAIYADQENGILTDNFAKGRINDVAEKLDNYQPGLGETYRSILPTTGLTMDTIINTGEQVLEKASIFSGQNAKEEVSIDINGEQVNIPKPKIGITEDKDKEFTPEQNKARELFREDVKKDLQNSGGNTAKVSKNITQETGIPPVIADALVNEIAGSTQIENAPIISMDLPSIGAEAMAEIEQPISEISPEALEKSIEDIFAGKTLEETIRKEAPKDAKKEQIQPKEAKEAKEKKAPTFEPAEFNEKFDENPAIFKAGTYIVDRDGNVQEVISGNDRYKKGEPMYDVNIGSLRTRQIGQKADYLNYANQVRPATEEEIVQAKEYEKKNPPKKEEAPVVKKTSKRKAKAEDTKNAIKVGDTFDTKGGTNMKSPVTVTSIEGRTVKFKDADGVEYAGMEQSVVKNMLKEGAWDRKEKSAVEDFIEEELTQAEKVAKAVKEKPKTIKEIAEETKILEPNVRRILGVGAKEGTFKRVDKGVYILSKDGEDMAYIETGSAMEVLPRLAKDGFKADMVFLDIPYKTSAITGGNRKRQYTFISVEEFGKVLDSIKVIARDQDSPVIHMFSQAPSGMKDMQKYNDLFVAKGFKPVGRGEYQKTYKDGSPVGFPSRNGYIITEPEGIIVFTQSGEVKKDLQNLNFKLVRPKGYDTEKPAEMLKAMIEMTTEEGDMVLDPFAGSGVAGAEAVKAGRKSYSIEKKPEVAEQITTPRIEKALKEGDKVAYTSRAGKEITGTVKDLDIDGKTALIDIDQIEAPGGVPVGRLQRVPTQDLTKVLSKREQMLEDYRKGTLPEFNMDKTLKDLDVFVDKVRELDPKKESDKFYIEKGAKYEVKTSYPASLGEMGNYDVSHYDEYPTVQDIAENTLELYNDFLKDVDNTARAENIANAITKAIDTYNESATITTYDRDRQKGISDTSDLPSGEDRGGREVSPSQVSRYDRATMLAQLGNGPSGEGTTSLTKKQRQLINQEVESILESKNYSTNQDDYSEDDRTLMRAYTGAGGKESVGATGAGLLNEYYTPPKVINKVWEIAKKLLPNAQTAFEPSVGTGRFIELSPVEVQVDGAEISKVSGTIASVLYPDSNITIGDFQELFFDKKTNKQKSVQQYDLVVGNPPFGDRAGFLKGKGEESDINREEEYFIKRGLDMVKEGGYLIYVVNSSFLKKGTSAGKNAISQLGKLEVAYRLPEDAFEDTTIGTDIVVFKKEETIDPVSVMTRNQTLRDDMYFRGVMNANNVLGETLVRKNRFGQQETYVKGSLDEAIDKINVDFLSSGEVKETETVGTIPEKEGVIYSDIQEEIPAKKAKKVSTPKKGVEYKQTVFPKKGATDLVVPKQNISNKTNYSPIEVNMLKRIDRDLAIQDPTPTEMPFLNYAGGEYFNDGVYFAGEIYKKLTQLENDKKAIIEKLGEQQYEKQKKGLEAVIPKRVPIKEIAFDPLDRHVAEMPTVVERYGKPEKSTVLNDFASWIRTSDVALSPRVTKWDVLAFVRGQNLPKGSKPIEGYIKSDAKRLFNQYLKNELNPEIQKEIENKYNIEKNGYVQPDYTKIPVEIEDMAKQFRGRDFMLSETQKNGIGFLVNKGSGLIAYGVGVGKTHTLAVATVANMQKGWSKRPLFIVPKSTIDKTWLATLQQMFPTLVINNLEGLQAPVIRRLIKEKGEDKTQWIKDGELTVISHEGILRLGLKEDELRTGVADLKDALWVEPKTQRGGEKTKSTYDEIAGNAQKYVTDVMLSDLGFDHISVDEVHNFRKVFQGAKAEKVDNEGRAIGKKRYANILGGTPSRRAQQLFLISQYIQKNNKNRNVFLASATPFENHATEVYNILSFIARDRMKSMGIQNINDFFATFANFEVELDRKLDGEWVNREKMKSFANLPTLQGLLKEFIDYQEDPTLVRPDRRVITPHLQMSELQQKNLVRIQNLLTGVKDQAEDTEGFDEESKAFYDVAQSTKEVDDGAFLKASTYSIANSVSPYFIKEYTRKVPTAKELVEDSPKIKYAIETLKTVKNDPKTADFGTFIFFGKMGVEYHPMIAEYIAKEVGYKPEEVAVLSGDVTDDEKEDIKERFNDGRVKVLLGGDQTKEGIDLQNNGFITMNLALGWNPTQISQVEGRVWRQGNRRSIAPLIYPLVENSGDSTIFNKFEEKGGRINDLFSYKGKMFDVGEIDPAEKKLALLTDPKDKAKMQIEIDKTATYNERLLIENDIKELKAINADKNQLTGDLAEFEKQLETGVDRWGGTLTDEEKKELKKEIKSIKGKIERLDARIEAKNITDINAEIGELEAKIIDIDAKIKAIDKTYDEKLAYFSEQYKQDLKKRKTMDQHMEEIKSLISEVEERTPEEIDEIRAKKIADEEARKAGSIPQFQTITRQPAEMTLKTLDRLGDRKTVSKQFISDLTRKTDIKKAEKEIIEDILARESDVVDVALFKEKVMEQVLPITIKDRTVSVEEAKALLKKKGIHFEEEMDGSAMITNEDGEYLEYDELDSDIQALVDSVLGSAETYQEMSGKRYERVVLEEELRGNVADYREHIYETPVYTSAGGIHFSGDTENYFGHTRVEDMKDGETRRVIEVQSDLFQRGRIDKESRGSEVINARISALEKEGYTPNQAKNMVDAEIVGGQLIEKREADISKLKRYNDPTAHFFMARKEINLAAKEGFSKIQFPTGETAMKIEGLGTSNNFYIKNDRGREGAVRNILKEELEVGKTVQDGASMMSNQWIITEVLGDGKFKAVPKEAYDKVMKGPGDFDWRDSRLAETFDISGNIDTTNPIYKFYEGELGKYLKNKYNAKPVTDLQGVTWYEVELTPEMKGAVEAFQKEDGIDETLITFEEAKQRVEEYKNRLKLDFDVDFADVIFTGGINKDGTKERAYAVTYNNKISLIDNVRRTTADHEMVHIVMNHIDKIKAFDGITRDQLLKAMNGGKDYTEADLERLNEEIAINFEKKVQGAEQSHLPIVLRKFFERLEILLTKLLKALGKDVDIIQDFYRRLYSARNKETVKLKSSELLDREVQFSVGDKDILAFNEARAEYLRTTRVDFQKIIEEARDHSINLRRKDINFFDQIFAQSRDLYLKDKEEFKQADELMKIGDERRMKKALLDKKFAKMLDPYFSLKKNNKAKVNEVLVQGDIEVKEYSDTELQAKGLSQAEIDAYKAVRKSFNIAHDLLLSEMEANGVPKEEIDQFRADRVGYLPHKWKYRFAIKKQVIKSGADPRDNNSWRTESMDVYRTAKEADKAFAELVKNNTTPDEVRYVNDTLDSLEVDFFSEQRFSFENMKSIIAKAKVPGEIKTEMLTGLRNMVKEKGFGRNFIKRTGIEGYEKKEIGEIIANYFAGLDGFITKMEAGKKYYGVLEKIDARRQKRFYEWTRNSIAYDMGNTKEGNAFKEAAYIYFLANDISFLATNMTQNFVVGIGELSKLVSGAEKIYKAETTLLKAMADWTLGKVTPEEKAVIDGLVNVGRLGGEMTAELMGFKNNPVYSSVSSVFNKALYNSTAVVEKNVNRVPAFLAARRLLKSKGLSDKEANEQALAISDDIHFRYGKQHRPEFMRGRKSILFVFNHYMRSFLYQLSRDLKNKEFMAVAKKLFYTTLLGGTASLPFAKLLKEIYKWIWGPDPDDEEEEELKTMDLALERGIPASYLNIDLSNKIGIDIMLLTNVVDDLKGDKSVMERVGTVMTNLIGAVGSLAFERIPKGLDLIEQGRYTEAGSKLLPDFVGNVLKAYAGATKGVLSQSGNPLIDENGDQFTYTNYEAFIRATGYVPTREQLAWDEQSKQWDLKNKQSSENAEVRDKIKKLVNTGKVEEARKYQEEARISGELSSSFDYVKDMVKDEAYRTRVDEWENGPQTRIRLDKMEREIAEDIYGKDYSAQNLTAVTEEFAFRRTFGYDDKNANDLRKATSNKDKVLVLKRIREELGPEEFRIWFNKGRKTVQYESGNTGYILISDNLKDLYLKSAK